MLELTQLDAMSGKVKFLDDAVIREWQAYNWAVAKIKQRGEHAFATLGLPVSMERIGEWKVTLR
jgi:hypothetical protein